VNGDAADRVVHQVMAVTHDIDQRDPMCPGRTVSEMAGPERASLSSTSRASGVASSGAQLNVSAMGPPQALIGERLKTGLVRERSRADLVVPIGAVTAGRGWPIAVKAFRVLMEPPIADLRACDLSVWVFRRHVVGLSRLIERLVTERRTGWCNFVPVAS